MIHIKIDWFKYSKLKQIAKKHQKTDAKKRHNFEKMQKRKMKKKKKKTKEEKNPTIKRD